MKKKKIVIKKKDFFVWVDFNYYNLHLDNNKNLKPPISNQKLYIILTFSFSDV